MKKSAAFSRQSNRRFSRREFLAASSAATAFMIVPSRVLGLGGETSANNKLNIAGVGVGGQGGADID
ncbi:MAG TPA: gfo/Idh/MocA family oxidoreductase, partial [Verrucomicrobiae bacterium]|nr:gfo/Idh/MocA family oxidoreductase [Verrucomicrobiae bacterium]